MTDVIRLNVDPTVFWYRIVRGVLGLQGGYHLLCALSLGQLVPLGWERYFGLTLSTSVLYGAVYHLVIAVTAIVLLVSSDPQVLLKWGGGLSLVTSAFGLMYGWIAGLPLSDEQLARLLQELRDLCGECETRFSAADIRFTIFVSFASIVVAGLMLCAMRAPAKIRASLASDPNYVAPFKSLRFRPHIASFEIIHRPLNGIIYSGYAALLRIVIFVVSVLAQSLGAVQGFLLSFILCLPFAGVWRVARRKASACLSYDADKLLRSSKERPIVLLRSFRDDDTWVRYRRFRERRLEEVIAPALKELGPLVAIGRPGEELPTLGAYRAYFRDDEWQSRVVEWLETARTIIVIIDDTPAVTWELCQISQLGFQSKTVFLVPPSKPGELGQRFERFASTGLSEARWMGAELAPDCQPLMFTFRGQCSIVADGRPVAESYMVAVRALAEGAVRPTNHEPGLPEIRRERELMGVRA